MALRPVGCRKVLQARALQRSMHAVLQRLRTFIQEAHYVPPEWCTARV